MSSISIKAKISKKLHRFDKFFWHHVPDNLFLRGIYLYHMKHWLNLSNPRRYTEKLQWLKLYNRDPLYTKLVDKAAMKDWVTEKLGPGYVIPIVGLYDSWDEIKFNELPDQFVIKCTHNCGVEICQDKATFDFTQGRRNIEASLYSEYYMTSREWPYKDVPHRILIEEFMNDESGQGLVDYKFFCFDGEVKFMFIATDRNSSEETKFDFYDTEFNHLPIVNGHPNSTKKIEKPKNFDEMLSIARKLSKGFPHVRVDLFSANGHIYVGEMTFFHFSGIVPFEPESWDYKIGSWLKLPEKKLK